MFSIVSFALLCGSSCSLHSIWLQLHSPACSDMVYTFSRVFIHGTFLWLVRAKHTVRIWIRHLSLPCGTETHVYMSGHSFRVIYSFNLWPKLLTFTYTILNLNWNCGARKTKVPFLVCCIVFPTIPWDRADRDHVVSRWGPVFPAVQPHDSSALLFLSVLTR